MKQAIGIDFELIPDLKDPTSVRNGGFIFLIPMRSPFRGPHPNQTGI